MTDHASKGAATQLCSAPASQEPDQCPSEKCTWVDDYDVCVPNRMAPCPLLFYVHIDTLSLSGPGPIQFCRVSLCCQTKRRNWMARA